MVPRSRTAPLWTPVAQIANVGNLWWDGAVTDESSIGGPDEARYVKEFFERLFPGMRSR
jgi:hypothetical protein